MYCCPVLYCSYLNSDHPLYIPRSEVWWSTLSLPHLHVPSFSHHCHILHIYCNMGENTPMSFHIYCMDGQRFKKDIYININVEHQSAMARMTKDKNLSRKMLMVTKTLLNQNLSTHRRYTYRISLFRHFIELGKNGKFLNANLLIRYVQIHYVC